MEERLTYLQTSCALESIFRKRSVITFMTLCKNRIYPRCKLSTDNDVKKFAIFTCAEVHVLSIEM